MPDEIQQEQPKPSTQEQISAARKQAEIEKNIALREELTGGVTPEGHAEALRTAIKVIDAEYKFNRGDLVRYKPFMRSTALPFDGYPAVVLRVLMGNDIVVVTPESKDYGVNSTPFFFDMVLAVMTPDGHIMTFYGESWRFEPFTVGDAQSAESPQS